MYRLVGQSAQVRSSLLPVLAQSEFTGQLLSISENSLLFSIIGTTFGGDGTNTFGLPNLRGRVAVLTQFQRGV